MAATEAGQARAASYGVLRNAQLSELVAVGDRQGSREPRRADPGIGAAASFYHHYVAPLKDPFILSVTHIAAGGVTIYAGGIALGQGVVLAPKTMGASLILSGAGVAVIGGGAYLVGCGIDHALHGLNQFDRIDIPTLSDRFSIFPSSPYEDH